VKAGGFLGAKDLEGLSIHAKALVRELMFDFG
jgi:hypothetical protein